MALYFMHLNDGENNVFDEQGSDYSSQSAAKSAAVSSLREIISTQVNEGVIDMNARITVMDADDNSLFEVKFADAVEFKAPKRVE